MQACFMIVEPSIGFHITKLVTADQDEAESAIALYRSLGQCVLLVVIPKECYEDVREVMDWVEKLPAGS